MKVRLAGALLGLLCLTIMYSRAQRRDTNVPSAKLQFDGSFYRSIPLSERSTTRGAAEPGWSPDGSEVVFSMLGSIWRMPSTGGDATQVTSASGYDGSPSWSPDGKSIAFIRGERPVSGVQIGVLGTLRVLDVASGSERVLWPDHQVIGTPVWAKDCLIVNEQQGTTVNLYRVPLDGAPAERMTGMLGSRVPKIVQRGSAWFHYWFPAAIEPGGSRIAFASDRDGTPQLWRMTPGSLLEVSDKLTRFAESEQADIQDLAWQDERTIWMSANLHSDRTNFDLWRWTGARGVERLTSTIHDEFSPRVSPDGKSILFVSNYLGDLDLFVTDTELSRVRHLRAGALRFQRPSGSLKIQVRGDSGPVAARISVRGADGKFYVPAGALYRYHAGMGDAAGFFHSAGPVTLQVPAGTVKVSAYLGLEHEPAAMTVSLAAGGDARAELNLRRKLNWQGKGWWSGEDHIHANYAGAYYMRPEDALLMADGEDLNVSNMLAANAEGERAYDREFFEGKVSSISKPGRILYWNEEYRNRILYGHMALLNLRQLTEPMFTSFEGTSSPFDYPLNTMVAVEARKKDAVVDYVHPMVGMSRDPFDSTVSAKELPVTAALGAVDVMDIYPWGPVALEMWYRLLNCGFRIAPGAGTDTFSNWRSINQLPGNFRVMVRSDQPLDYAGWIGGLRSGRSFVTNGPMVRLQVNGKEPGGTVETGDLDLSIRVESLAPVRKIEIIRNGAPVAAFDANGQTEGQFRWKQRVQESGWVAVRVSGDPSPRALGAPAQAHTAPVYVIVNGSPMRPKAEDARFFVRWVDRLEDLIELRNNFEKPEHKRQALDLIARARKLYLQMSSEK